MIAPRELTGHLAGGHVPEFYESIVTACGECATVRAERHSAEPVLMRAEQMQRLAGPGVPEAHLMVVAGGRECRAIRTCGDRGHHGAVVCRPFSDDA